MSKLVMGVISISYHNLYCHQLYQYFLLLSSLFQCSGDNTQQIAVQYSQFDATSVVVSLHNLVDSF
jgi:hypothetical protein